MLRLILLRRRRRIKPVFHLVLGLDPEEVDGERVEVVDGERGRVGGRLHRPIPLALLAFPVDKRREKNVELYLPFPRIETHSAKKYYCAYEAFSEMSILHVLRISCCLLLQHHWPNLARDLKPILIIFYINS